jgi:hypothetical protein
MFKTKSNKIFPEKIYDTNDPIQARIYENYLNLRRKNIKPIKRKSNTEQNTKNSTKEI